MDLEVRQAFVPELRILAAFYARCGYGGGVGTGDQAILALEGDVLRGALRLCQERGVQVLRGMQVAPEWRGRGVGGRLLKGALPWMQRPCFCIAHGHLRAFYGRAGFLEVPRQAAPPHLSARLQGYASRHPGLVLLVRAH